MSWISTGTSATLDSFRLEPLLELARQRSGITDDTDHDIVVPLNRLLESLRDDAALPERGIQAMHAHLVELLVMRRRMRETMRQHPEIAAETLRGPVIVLGLARSGTTKMQRSLGASGCFQTLPLWKILNPLPLQSDPPGADSRIALAEQFVALLWQAFPHMLRAHEMIATEPEEESLLMEQSFFCESATWLARVPGYQRWVVARNNVASYRWLAQALQLLQWQDEQRTTKRRWVLKSPIHIGRLDEIFTVFPDAVVVHCHRDPLVAVPSAAALTEAMRAMYSDRVDALEAGRFAMEALTQGMRSYMTSRPRWEAAGKCIIDVRYERIVRDMPGVAAEIGARIGEPLSADARAAITRWEDSHPPHRHGGLDYGLERYGLDEAAIRGTFADYTARFLPNGS